MDKRVDRRGQWMCSFKKTLGAGVYQVTWEKAEQSPAKLLA